MRRRAAVASGLARVSRLEPGLAARQVLSALEVEVTVNSPLRLPGERGALIVANHVSWLGIIALQALAPVGFLAKVNCGDGR
ncbi:MAG TPA: hypothetical protein VJT49_25455 [Amycolatopsis sp.]|uniref:hypothetical protein n=1 Tax=Amycolatopsis sp. TaxID=37632 RepID=UPI002B46CEDF|nr:hypothetical protein [Amycolatopsis sp.]HKS48397.1 hypothetical protein [Amycolatopsis sp.]